MQSAPALKKTILTAAAMQNSLQKCCMPLVYDSKNVLLLAVVMIINTCFLLTEFFAQLKPVNFSQLSRNSICLSIQRHLCQLNKVSEQPSIETEHFTTSVQQKRPLKQSCLSLVLIYCSGIANTINIMHKHKSTIMLSLETTVKKHGQLE